MALPSSTANWHWKNKGVTGWGRQWFEENLTTVIFTEGSATAGISGVSNFEGDVEMGMRKSKLLTIYDCNLTLSWTGTATDGTSVEGTLNIPEVSHEITLDGSGEYQFDFTLKTSPANDSVQQLYTLVRRQLPPLLKAKFAEFPEALLAAHGKDLKVEGSGYSTPANGTSTPATGGGSAIPLNASALNAAVKPKGPVLNFSTIKVEAELRASSDDIFDFLTDEARIPAWSRASAKSKPIIGSDYAIFGGNITGKYLNIARPSKIVQTWGLKSPTWPSGHSGTLTTTIDQQSDHTKVTWELEGVPKGQEEELTNNLKGYYLQGFQSIGYVLVSRPQSSINTSPSKSLPKTSTDDVASPSLQRHYIAGFIAVALLAATISSRYLS